MTAPRSMSDERQITNGVAAVYVTFAPSPPRVLRRAYLPITPDVRAPSQTARIHPAGLLRAPLVQAAAQTIGLNSERLADHFESERPVTIAVQNPPFGLAERPAPGTALGVGVSLEAAHRVGQHREHQPLDGLRFGIAPAHAVVILHRHQDIGHHELRVRAFFHHRSNP